MFRGSILEHDRRTSTARGIRRRRPRRVGACPKRLRPKISECAQGRRNSTSYRCCRAKVPLLASRNPGRHSFFLPDRRPSRSCWGWRLVRRIRRTAVHFDKFGDQPGRSIQAHTLGSPMAVEPDAPDSTGCWGWPRTGIRQAASSPDRGVEGRAERCRTQRTSSSLSDWPIQTARRR